MTQDHIRILHHTLGLDRAKKPYRNFFAAPAGGNDLCEDLVRDGFMQRFLHEGVQDGVMYSATYLGKDLAAATKKKVSK